MTPRRKLRSARKLRRIYVATVLIWCLSLLVFWAVRGLHAVIVDPLDPTNYDTDFYLSQVIYVAMWLVVLIIALVIETLIFGKRKPTLTGAIDDGEPVRVHVPHREPRLGTTPSRIDPSR